jgi:hypothetical protein
MGVGRGFELGGRSRVDDRQRAAGRHPVIPGRPGFGRGLPSGPVDRRDRGEIAGGRPARAVEQGELARPVPEEAQHRQHAVDRPVQGRRGVEAAAREEEPEREQVEQQLGERLRVPAEMAAVRQDLRLQLGRESADRPPERSLQPLAAEPGEAQPVAAASLSIGFGRIRMSRSRTAAARPIAPR